MARPSRPLVLYQDTCRFCRGAARLLARLDRREELAMLGFGDPAAAPYISGIPVHELDSSWQLILPMGERLMEGRAAIAALEAVRATGWVGRLLRILRMGALVDLAYRAVAHSRGFFGRFVADRPGPRRLP